MGVVYRGHDEVRGADVAIKMVQSPDAPHILRWFLRGARLAQKITHPHVVETLDHGRLDNGAAFLVMELVEGINFEDVLHSALPLPHKVHLLSQVLQALAYVHARGILHRDIKPENLLIIRNEEGRLLLKTTDFGLAALYGSGTGGEDGFDAADKQWVTGTPYYMAPERIDESLPVGPASDLYSVGVMLYHLISGDLPFPQPGLRGMYLKQTEEAPELESKDGIEVPLELVHIAARLVRRRAEERYRVAADVLNDLAPHHEPFTLSPEEWVALAPLTLDKKFAEVPTLAVQEKTANQSTQVTTQVLRNPGQLLSLFLSLSTQSHRHSHTMPEQAAESQRIAERGGPKS